MEGRRGPRTRAGWTRHPALHVGAYYLLIGAAIVLLWRLLPSAWRAFLADPMAAPTGDVNPSAMLGYPADAAAVGARARVFTAVGAMVGATLLVLPVAWLYTWTRRRKGFDQSVVHSLVLLAPLVAGVVVLVKHSLALAFSLAGIMAAVRFRNTLEDSRDAVYIFAVTGIGLAAGVDLGVGVALSVVFNLLAMLLWTTDFGRAHQGRPGDDAEPTRRDVVLRVRTLDGARSRLAVERILDEHAKRWSDARDLEEDDDDAEKGREGTAPRVLEYRVRLRKGDDGGPLLDALRRQGAPHVLDVELD